MTALCILGGVLLLLALLLIAPVALEIRSRDDDLEILLCYLWFRFDFAAPRPIKEKPPKKSGQPRAEKKKERKESTTLWKLEDGLDALWELLLQTRPAGSLLRRHLVFSRVKLYISVGGEDTACIAERFGQINAAVFAGLSILGSYFVLRPPTLGIAPAFQSSSTRWDVRGRVGIRLYFLLAAACLFLVHMRTYSKKKLCDNNKKVVTK